MMLIMPDFVAMPESARAYFFSGTFSTQTDPKIQKPGPSWQLHELHRFLGPFFKPVRILNGISTF